MTCRPTKTPRPATVHVQDENSGNPCIGSPRTITILEQLQSVNFTFRNSYLRRLNPCIDYGCDHCALVIDKTPELAFIHLHDWNLNPVPNFAFAVTFK